MSDNTEILKTKKRKIRSDKGKKRKEKRKEYICDKCGYTTQLKTASVIHYLNYHAIMKERIEQYKFFCDKCNFGSMSKVSYNTHLNTKKHKYMMRLIKE